MSTTWKAIAFSTAAIVLALAVLLGGFYLGRATSPLGTLAFGQDYRPYGPMMGRGSLGSGMMGQDGMMGSGMMGPGSWGRGGRYQGEYGSHGPMMRGASSGMMEWYGSQALDVEPLEIEAAEGAALEYLEQFGYEGLEISEVMIFDNHAYVQVVETDSEIGAMELLVDPISGQAYPEHGPNMMWNLKYGHMASGAGMMGRGMMGRGMMGTGMLSQSFSYDLEDFEMDISEERAVALAQDYLDRIGSGWTADEHADAFYGYYTIHTLKDGDVTGMLSVNGFTGEVFPHTWHGTLLEMTNH